MLFTRTCKVNPDNVKELHDAGPAERRNRSMGQPEHPSILIVDDDMSFVRAAAEIARSVDYEVTVAGTVEQASARLQRGNFDLALIDLTLPDGSGMDLVEHCDIAHT